MKKIIQSKHWASIFSLLLILSACSKPEGESVPKGVEIVAGAGAWLSELGKLKQPSGILPNGTGYAAANIIYRDPTTFNEFFAFDENVSLILLSNNPVYFIKIESRDFRFHLNNELTQINQGFTGDTKKINTLTYYKQVGDHSVEVYFTPKELNFTSGSSVNAGRIKDKNDTTYVDLWKLSEAAADVVLYTPLFEEQKIADDFVADSVAGKKRLILTDSSTMVNPNNYNISALGLNFSAMLGSGLTLTDNILGSEDIRFVDRYALTRDFAAFFSVPIGNSKDAVNNHLSQKDGIVVIIRGNISKFRDFLMAQGMNFSQVPAFNMSQALPTTATTLAISLNGAPNSSQAQNIANYCIALTADGNCNTPDLTVTGASVSGSTITLTTSAQSVGAAYTVYVSGVTRSNDGAALSVSSGNFSGYKPLAGIKITEVFIDDSADSIEFRITSAGYLDGMKIYISGVLRYTFPNSNPFNAGDMIVFHAQAAGTNETTSNASLSVDAGATAGFDFWQAGSAITSTDAEAEIQSALSVTLDYVAWVDGSLASGQQTRVDNKIPADWTIAGSTTASTDLVDSTADDGTNRCLQRINTGAGTSHTDTNAKTDWMAGTCALGTNQSTVPPAFNVNSAASTANTTITVTFSTNPDLAQAQTITNYCIALTADGNCSTPDLSITNAVLSGATVTLTTSSQTGGAYTVYVTGVTAPSVGTALTTSTANFTGTTPPAFNVNSASSTTSTTMTVTFSAAPNTVQAQTNGNYCIALTADGNCSTPDLTISGAVLAGSTVTLTTSAQISAAAYTIYVTGVTSSVGATALTTSTANFVGFATPAVLVINEVNTNITSCDLIELRVTQTGSISGFVLKLNGTALPLIGGTGFPSIIVNKNDYIVIHLNYTNATCFNGVPSLPSANETSINQFPQATYVGSTATNHTYDNSYDFFSTNTGMTHGIATLQLETGTGTVVDFVPLANLTAGTTGYAAGRATEAQNAVTALQWNITTGPADWTCVGGTNCAAVGAWTNNGANGALIGTTTSNSMCRNSDVENNIKADWSTCTATASWGANNPGQSNL